MMKLTEEESELFFCMDHSWSARYEDYELSHYDRDEIRGEAVWFSDMLTKMGHCTLDVDALVEDFFRRFKEEGSPARR